MPSTIRIGVVGGGAAAVCLLDALSQATPVPAVVTVFDDSPTLWRGRAYQPDATAVRVNAPPDDMSIRAGDPHHFERWFAERGLAGEAVDAETADPWSGVRFVPRATYGDYLEQSARTALRVLLDRDCEVHVVREAVVHGAAPGSGMELEAGSGDRYEMDVVVLCVGGGGPADSYGLSGMPGFIGDPYPVVGRLAVIDPDEPVAVIGSGLTAVDAVLALAAVGHRGPISMLSRRAVLPAVRQCPADYRLAHFTPETFRALKSMPIGEAFEIMRAELRHADVDIPALIREVTGTEVEDPVERLRRHLAAVDHPDLGLRILQRAVPDTGPDVWPILPEHDKSYLMSEHHRTIMSLCCPMPPANGHRLLALIESGQLDLPRGLREIKFVDGFQAVLADGVRDYSTVVNAVSAPTHRIPSGAGALIASLRRCGLVERHPRGGLDVERATSRLRVGGRTDDRIYALGDLAAGALFFTFGIPSLVDRAVDIVAAINTAPVSTATLVPL
ncbi:FAD/NAD(P)-binding protein [Sphaerimonospora thailandensis]|uniref:Hydroxyacylglutathione hydrolase n=1 Tax=Sphaerimonospora thailandensis TaxID=795644 RepID=A0A8J3REY5_9ACTN|nr:FAD/NAD(P)-binding protein [Sphaerimonospora thailandensis]GIH72489.1 hydroxyacylglutathione hydrolase [Sphaerimonospora thailandensis]